MIKQNEKDIKNKSSIDILIDNLILKIVRSKKIKECEEEIELLKWLLTREKYK